MILLLSAVLLASAASAAPAPAAPAAAAPVAASVRTSTAAAAVPALVGLSTYTISTLYTGDRVRDPFLPTSMGGPARIRDKETPLVADIHTMQLRGIMKDGVSDFALFSMDDGTTLVLRGTRLYDDRNKPVPGITGRIQIKQKRAELMTTDKDVQIYSLGETDDVKDKAAKP
jgi:Tfp pilus assembly protein PilP